MFLRFILERTAYIPWWLIIVQYVSPMEIAFFSDCNGLRAGLFSHNGCASWLLPWELSGP